VTTSLGKRRLEITSLEIKSQARKSTGKRKPEITRLEIKSQARKSTGQRKMAITSLGIKSQAKRKPGLKRLEIRSRATKSHGTPQKRNQARPITKMIMVVRRVKKEEAGGAALASQKYSAQPLNATTAQM